MPTPVYMGASTTPPPSISQVVGTVEQVATEVAKDIPPTVAQNMVEGLVSDAEGVLGKMSEATVQWVIRWAAVTVFFVLISAAICMEVIVLRDGNTPLVQDMTDKLNWLITTGFGALILMVGGKTAQHVATVRQLTKKQG